MQTDMLLIGRDTELSQLQLMLGPGTDGLRFARLTGPSGLGKTTLTAASVQLAEEHGFTVAATNGRAGALSVPLAPWVDALPGFANEINQVAGATPDGVELERLGAVLVDHIVEATRHNPLLQVIDESQSLDESSIALIPFVAGLSENVNLSVLLVEQTDAVGVSPSYRAVVDDLVARRVVQHLELTPLADEAISELITAAGIDDADPARDEIILRAQGNPWFAKELAAAHIRGEESIPVSISAAATARLYRLDEPVRDLVSAVALCDDGAHLDWLEGLANQRPREFARTIENILASGLVREDGDIISIAHPLMQQALNDELSSAMRRALHLELAEVIAETQGNPVLRARGEAFHLGRAGRHAESVAAWTRSADANEIANKLHEAYSDLEHALAHEVSDSDRVELLKRCAYAGMQLGSERAVRYWNELARTAAALHDNETYAYALFQLYWTSNDGRAKERLERAASLGAESYGWSARAAATLARMSGDWVTAEQHDRHALKLAEASEDVLLMTLASEKLASTLADSGQISNRETITFYRRAIDLAVRNRLHGWVVPASGALAETLEDLLDTAASADECVSALRYIDDMSLERLRPAALAWHARALVRLGNLEAARTTIDMADTATVNQPEYVALVEGVRAEVLNEIGDVGSAASVLDNALVLAEELGYAQWALATMFQRARMLARTGDLDAAVQLLSTLEDEEPVTMTEIALWAARAGVMYERDDLLGIAARIRTSDIYDGVSLPVVDASLAEIDAILGLGNGATTDALTHAATTWESHDRHLDALRARMCVALYDSATLSGKPSPRQLDELKELRARLAACGAGHDADIVAARLRKLGARSRAKSRTTTVGNLPRRELEIARLVAAGLRNSDVAAQLFLSEKTVAAHLSNIYGKLEVRSRVKLTAWLQENDPELSATITGVAS